MCEGASCSDFVALFSQPEFQCRSCLCSWSVTGWFNVMYLIYDTRVLGNDMQCMVNFVF